MNNKVIHMPTDYKNIEIACPECYRPHNACSFLEKHYLFQN